MRPHLDRRLERLDEQDEQGLVELGCDLSDAGRHTDAERCFRRAAAVGSVVGEFNLGNSLAAQGRWRAAAVAYERAAKRGETDAWRNLALVREELGDAAGAAAAFRAGADAGDPVATGVLASRRWHDSLDTTAEAALREAADHFPPARVDLADLLQATGRVDEALDVLQAGARHGEPECWLPLGDLYLNQLDNPVAAEVAFRAAVEAGDELAQSRLRELPQGSEPPG